MSGHHAVTAVGRHQGRLVVVLALTAVVLVAEVVAGWWTGSLALWADAGHMLTDVAGLVLALVAVRVSARPPSDRYSFGLHRVEILAALVNGVALIGVSLYVLVEAWRRFREPPTVDSGPMLAVAALGLVVNLCGMMILRAGAGESLNLKGAYLEVLSDAVTSLGVIVAAVVMLTTGWWYADPVVSALIGVFMLPRTWRLTSEAVNVLLEGTPDHIDVGALRVALLGIPGVLEVYDLHVWTVTSGVDAMSAHVVASPTASRDEVLAAVRARVAADFGITHTTIQVEGPDVPRGMHHE